MKKENINLSLKDGYLEVTAEVKKEDDSEEKDKFVHKERYYGHCSRSFYVGEQIKEEDVNAEFKNGILKICIPKKKKEKNFQKQNILKLNNIYKEMVLYRIISLFKCVRLIVICHLARCS